MKRGVRPTSQASHALSMSSLRGSQECIRTLQRQHKITIRRLDNIARKMEIAPDEEPPPSPTKGSNLVAWFMRLIR